MTAASESARQEALLADELASLTEYDIPPDDDARAFPDPDCGRPAELADLSTAELDELVTATATMTREAEFGPAGYGAAGYGAARYGAARYGVAGYSAARSGPRDPSGFAEGGVLDALAPGVALAGLTDDAHAGLAGLTDDELIGVLRAWRRQASWVQARELAATAELARRRPARSTPPARPAPPGEFPDQLSEFIAAELALALTLTQRAAGTQLDLALGLAARPATAAALEAGRIDLPRTRVIIDGVAGLSPPHAAAVEAAVLPQAPGMTTGQLRAEVARAVLAADPSAARKQREEELKDARVECWADPVGTANLAGRNLPSAETLAADQRLGQIAAVWKKQIRAAWKQADPGAGESRPPAGTDLLRARAYLKLLLGQPVDVPPADLLPPAISGADDPDNADHPRIPPGLRRPGRAPDALPPLAGSICLTLPLATLLGLSDAPGEAAGYGPIDPDTGRALARAAVGYPTVGHPAAEWHLILTDPHGRAVGYGHAPRARPTHGQDGDGWTITLTTQRIARGQSP